MAFTMKAHGRVDGAPANMSAIAHLLRESVADADGSPSAAEALADGMSALVPLAAAVLGGEYTVTVFAHFKRGARGFSLAVAPRQPDAESPADTLPAAAPCVDCP